MFQMSPVKIVPAWIGLAVVISVVFHVVLLALIGSMSIPLPTYTDLPDSTAEAAVEIQVESAAAVTN